MGENSEDFSKFIIEHEYKIYGIHMNEWINEDYFEHFFKEDN